MPAPARIPVALAIVALLCLATACSKKDDEMTGLRPKAGARATVAGNTNRPAVNTPDLPTAPPADDDDDSPGDDDDDDDQTEKSGPPLSPEAAKNHPYAKELVGAMQRAWSPPANAKGTVRGCIRLSPNGAVVARMVQKAGNEDLEDSVKTALDGFTGVGRSIPKRLAPRLTGWVCATFTPPK